MVTSSVACDNTFRAPLFRSTPTRNSFAFLCLHTLKTPPPATHCIQRACALFATRRGMGYLFRKCGAMGGAGFFRERKPRFRDVANAFQRPLHLGVLGF